MNNKKEIYKTAIVCYGFLALLVMLDQYEEEENFEECKIILETLKEHAEKYKIKIPFKLSDQAIEEYKYEFTKLGYSGDIAIGNIPFYVKQIKKQLNQI